MCSCSFEGEVKRTFKTAKIGLFHKEKTCLDMYDITSTYPKLGFIYSKLIKFKIKLGNVSSDVAVNFIAYVIESIQQQQQQQQQNFVCKFKVVVTFVERSRKKQSLSRWEAREISFKFLFYTLVSCKKYTFLEKIECKGNWKEKVMKNYKHTQNIYINSYTIINSY